MNKKVISIIAFIMVGVLCFPSVNVHAMEKTEFIIRTTETVGEGLGGDFSTYLLAEVFPETDHGYITNMLEALEDFDFSILADYDNYVVVCIANNNPANNPSYTLKVYLFNSSKEPYILMGGTNTGNKNILYGLIDTSIASPIVYQCGFTSTSNSYGGGWTHESFALNDAYYYPSGSGNGYRYTQLGGYWGFVVDTSLPVYILPQVTQLSGYDNDQRFSWTTIDGNRQSLTNIFEESLEGYNAQGSIVSGAPQIAEQNPHLGFRKFDSQVIYNQVNKTSSSARLVWEVDPLSYNIIENEAVENWEMMLECRLEYNIGVYADGNVLVPYNQYSNQFVFNTVYAFDSYNDIKAGSIAPLDFISAFDNADKSDIAYTAGDISLMACLLGGMQGNYSRGNANVDKYGLFGGNLLEALGYVASTLGASKIQEALGITFGDWLDEHTNTNYYYAVDNCTMTIKGTLRSRSSVSLEGTTYCDFLTHTTSSYTPGVTPEATEENPEPTPQPPVENTNDKPIVPSGIDSNGNMTYVEVVVNNNSSGGGGGSSSNPIINYNPSNDVVIDYGVDEMIDAVDKYPEVTNKKFWDYFLIFKDNDFLEATTDWWNALPDEITDLLIASIGIISVFSIYRWIRRG